MAINTRFNPTINGSLHLGHLYLCLVNEYEAHNTGGVFSVRFDDAKPCTQQWSNTDLDKVARCRQDQLDDLAPFVTVDYHWSELENHWRLAQLPRTLILDRNYTQHPHKYPEVIRHPATHVTGAGEQYPYVPNWTAEKVFFDMITGVNWLIRGDDLLSEFALYHYFAEILAVPPMRHTYIPRLQPEGGRFDTVSKTTGGHGIKEAVDRLGVDGVVELLRNACLVDPDGPFSVANIKARPILPK